MNQNIPYIILILLGTSQIILVLLNQWNFAVLVDSTAAAPLPTPFAMNLYFVYENVSTEGIIYTKDSKITITKNNFSTIMSSYPHRYQIMYINAITRSHILPKALVMQVTEDICNRYDVYSGTISIITKSHDKIIQNITGECK